MPSARARAFSSYYVTHRKCSHGARKCTLMAVRDEKSNFDGGRGSKNERLNEVDKESFDGRRLISAVCSKE